MTDRDGPRPLRKEPMFTAPPLALLIPVILVAIYAVQAFATPQMQDAIMGSFALSSLLLRNGDYLLLVTHIFLHGSWLHVGANSAFCLAFATPVVRAMGYSGQGWRGGGVLSYLAFFLICGVVAGLGYCLLNWRSAVPMVGASGAISGLMGAAIRLRSDPFDPDIKGLLHPRVLAMTVTFCLINAGMAFAPFFVGDGMTVAWQAHIVGYLFGLLAISPWMRLLHHNYFTTS